ncbi:MAG: hypothetical protein ACLTOV_12510 [Phocaeicola sp.]
MTNDNKPKERDWNLLFRIVQMNPVSLFIRKSRTDFLRRTLRLASASDHRKMGYSL